MSIIIIPLGQECGVRESPEKISWAPNLRCVFYSSAIRGVRWQGVRGPFSYFLLMDCIIFLMLNENEAVHFASVFYNRSPVED